jgi:hypothetical protein
LESMQVQAVSLLWLGMFKNTVNWTKL